MGRKTSSGILIYRKKNFHLEFYLVHPGGPIFKNKDAGHWGIPKGEIHNGEDELGCAIREVKEEIGLDLSGKNFIQLGSITQKGGKLVHAWACEFNDELVLDNSNSMVEMQWPPIWGKKIVFPEIDRGEFFKEDIAEIKMKPAQFEFIVRLKKELKVS
jgi:predicted NUDIX family NTP pyrophosphohydrolase